MKTKPVHIETPQTKHLPIMPPSHCTNCNEQNWDWAETEVDVALWEVHQTKQCLNCYTIRTYIFPIQSFPKSVEEQT